LFVYVCVCVGGKRRWREVGHSNDKYGDDYLHTHIHIYIYIEHTLEFKKMKDKTAVPKGCKVL
jgi:hypothetical protein